jgi:hypothetical protein
MRKILTTLLLLTVDVPAAPAEWTPVNTVASAANAIQYASLSTIQRSGSMAEMWDLTNFSSAGAFHGAKYYSLKSLRQYDCMTRTYRTLDAMILSGSMGHGTVITPIVNSPTRWKPVVARSIGEDLSNIACNRH